MSNPFDDASADFQVLLNHEDQYSLWPALRDPPSGWVVVLPRAVLQDCLAWIDTHWKDMRPLSFRQR